MMDNIYRHDKLQLMPLKPVRIVFTVNFTILFLLWSMRPLTKAMRYI